MHDFYGYMVVKFCINKFYLRKTSILFKRGTIGSCLVLIYIFGISRHKYGANNKPNQLSPPNK